MIGFLQAQKEFYKQNSLHLRCSLIGIHGYYFCSNASERILSRTGILLKFPTAFYLVAKVLFLAMQIHVVFFVSYCLLCFHTYGVTQSLRNSHGLLVLLDLGS